jgi:hypothetical protein
MFRRMEMNLNIQTQLLVNPNTKEYIGSDGTWIALPLALQEKYYMIVLSLIVRV